MSDDALQKRKMTCEVMLAKIEDTLMQGNGSEPPAYTLVLGAGASFGVVPTAKEMLGFPEAKTQVIHEKSIPLWLARKRGETHDTEAAKQQIVRQFWTDFQRRNQAGFQDQQMELHLDPGSELPLADSIPAAYQAVFEMSCIGGLDSPEKHQAYMRDVTLSGTQTKLNATHFYLASLLSLQTRSGELGASGKPLYRGRREFARTLFTTNFDPLLQTSLQLFQRLYYMTDRPEALAADGLQTDQHSAIHLFYAHGSVHRPFMANTGDQISLLKQNARDLAAYLGNHGVIVLGYSGWDDCLLEALKMTPSFANNLYWLARGEKSLSPKVRDFLKSHTNAFWVEIDDGGSFMARLHSRLCPGAPNTAMLYNPIRPLIQQLECVDLTGIPLGETEQERELPRGLMTASGMPDTVDELRSRVIQVLSSAEQEFLHGKPEHPVSYRDLMNKAAMHYANKDWQAAEKFYTQVLEEIADISTPAKSEALEYRASCHYLQRANHQAIADLTAVIMLEGAPITAVAEALNNRGVCYFEMNKTVEAMADYTTLIKLEGAPVVQVAKALINRGWCNCQMGKNREAVADYTASIELVGVPVEQVAKALINRGWCRDQTNNSAEAVADYSAVIELVGAQVEQVAKALLNRGICYGQLNEISKEVADYSAVIELEAAPVEQVAKALFNRGICYDQLKKPAKAKVDFATLSELKGAPEDLVALARIELLALSAIPT